MVTMAPCEGLRTLPQITPPSRSSTMSAIAKLGQLAQATSPSKSAIGCLRLATLADESISMLIFGSWVADYGLAD